MPHIIFEYSSNIIEKNNLESLFPEIHQLLEQEISAKISECKTRAIEHKSFLVGDANNKENAFIHLTIKIMPGRSDELKNNLAKEISKKLTSFFIKSKQKLEVKFSIEISELENYHKF